MMLGFMDYVQQAFFTASHWNPDNSYGSLTATARGMLICYPMTPPSYLSLDLL